jgi:peptidyl-prolyl cis-trans isomerase C
MTTVHDTTAHAACGLKPLSLPRPKPVTVNGVTISRDAIARETQNHPAGKPVEAWLAAGRALVVRELLLQEAQRLGLTADHLEDDEGRRETHDEALIRTLIEHKIIVPAVDEAACRRLYEMQRNRFCSADIYEARHILLAANPDDAAARDAARTLAASLISILAVSPDRFAELAVSHSACPSAHTGGHLGQISSGQTVPEFEAALAGLPCGSVAPQPVETRYGLHVVLVDRHIPGEVRPFDDVREHVARWLAAKARREAIHQYISFLAAQAEIEGIAIGSSSPDQARQGG